MKLFHKMALSVLVLMLAFGLLVTSLVSAGEGPNSMKTTDQMHIDTVKLPLVAAWYDGQTAYYIQTEASDPQVAEDQGVNFVPKLANAIEAGIVDDIYVITNFKQANIIPSAPIPAGPGNADPDYSPLWQVNIVTWNEGTTPYTLRSEDEVKAAETDGLVEIVKTNIVVNCPVIFTPQGGLLPTAKISLIDDKKPAMRVVGTVYTMTNDPSDNQIIRYDRASDGTLSKSGTFSTGGMGTGNGLGNQGGLVLSEDGKMLLVVNAGSDEISVFKVKSKGLELTDKVSSGGTMPVSIAIRGKWVYVLNAGGTGNIAGFYLKNDGKLSPIPGSTRDLSGEATGPAQISFHPYWNVLVVTEKATDTIDTYLVDFDGKVAEGPMTYASNGPTPFGFAFDVSGNLIVSEAFGGEPEASALSSYGVDLKGNLETKSSSVPDFQTAACWVVLTKDGRFAYTTNFGSDSISSYKVQNGMITLLEQVAGTTGGGPIDMALSQDGMYLYSLNSVSHSITGFRVSPLDGSLTPVDTVGGLPDGANGLAAR